MEKPVAVDAPGIRKVLEIWQKLPPRRICWCRSDCNAGTKEPIAKPLNNYKTASSAILLYSRVYWNSNGVWERPRKPGDTELTYQMRNWYYFNWLCGDHIVEQHIHNLDVINWLMDDSSQNGSREWEAVYYVPAQDHGQIFDHHFVEYTYANGHKMFSQCRHMPQCSKERF